MQLAGRPASKAPAPRTTLPPTHAAFHGGVGHAIQAAARAPAPAPRSVGRAVQHAAAPAYHPSGARLAGRPGPEQHATGGGSDIQTSGASYGRAQADAYKKSVAYRRAIVETFLHQPDPIKTTIVQRALQHPSAEGKMVLDAVKSMVPKGAHENLQAGTGKNIDAGPTILAGLEHMFSPKQVIGGGDTLKGTASGNQGAGIPGIGTILPFRGLSGVKQIAANSGKDLVNLPGEAFSTVGTLGGDVLQHNFGKLASDALGQYKQIAANPGAAFYAHPVDTTLAVAAPLHGITKLGADAVRAIAPRSAAAKALGPRYEVPPSVHLTGDLTHERPALSSYPLTRAGQKTVAKGLYKKAPTGDLIPRTEFLRERLLRKEVSRNVGVRERIRRAFVDQQKAAHADSVLMSRGKRLARSAKKALTYNPGSGLIHGANVLARVEDHTIRRPDIFHADLQKHLDSVARTRPDLHGMPEALADHDKYVAELKAALADKALRDPKNLQPLFDAAHRYAKDVAPLQNLAHAHDHYGDMSKEGLLRRELQPVVLSHMPGARLDSKLGMVRDVNGVPQKLSTKEMVAFDRAQTGGRPLAYTSHATPKGDSAFFKSQQKYPARAIEKNTGYAFTHGLSDPTHEALLQHRVELENVINAHRSMDQLLTATVEGREGGGYWKNYKDAKADAPKGYVPIQVGRLTVKENAGAPSTIDREAAIRSLDINERLRPVDTPGKFGVIDSHVVDQLKQHQNQISPNTFLRAARASTSQFRRVALGTSVRHIPGVAQEGLIRDIGAGVGIRSGLSGRNVFRELEKIDPRIATERRVELTGGTVAGMTRMMETRQGSRFFSGTALGPPMRAVETLFRSPGPRQLATAWNHWQSFVITGSKRVLESTQQTAGVGQALLKESGQLMHLQGKAAQEAAKGLLSDKTARQLSAQVRRVYGTWTDMTPHGQMALMFSPFGMWWVNSVKWLARLPVDQPIKTGLLASATVGTEKQRQAEGLDMFSPNHLAGYLQGSIPAGNKLIAQNYYSPFGVAGDPAGTIASLTEPTLMPVALALLGDNWLGRPLRSPSDPHGRKQASEGTAGLVALNSLLANFVPLYTKLQTVRQGGASSFDTSTAFSPQTKGPNPGVAKGLLKLVQPTRSYPKPNSSSSSGSSSTGSGWGPSTSSSSGSSGSSGGASGWGPSSSSSSSSASGWGP